MAMKQAIMNVSDRGEITVPELFEVAKSTIDGNGAIALKHIEINCFIGIAFILKTPERRFYMVYDQTILSRYLNHSWSPNAEFRLEEDGLNTYAIEDIEPGIEITVDYGSHKELSPPRPYWK